MKSQYYGTPPMLVDHLEVEAWELYSGMCFFVALLEPEERFTIDSTRYARVMKKAQLRWLRRQASLFHYYA